MTPWITKPVPFNIGQGAAAAAETTYSLLWENTAGGSFDDNQSEIYYANEFDTNTAVIGEPITKITVGVKKTGSPTATLTGYLWFGTLADAPSKTSVETYGAADISTSVTTLTFTFTNTTDTLQGYLAGFAFSAAGSGSDHYNIDRIITGAVDGTYAAKAKDLSSPPWLYPDSKGACMTNSVYTSP